MADEDATITIKLTVDRPDQVKVTASSAERQFMNTLENAGIDVRKVSQAHHNGPPSQHSGGGGSWTDHIWIISTAALATLPRALKIFYARHATKKIKIKVHPGGEIEFESAEGYSAEELERFLNRMHPDTGTRAGESERSETSLPESD